MKSLFFATATVACSLLFSACSKDEQDAAPLTTNTSPAAAAKEAAQASLAKTYARVEIDTDAGLYWFEPRRCAIGPDADSGVVGYSIEGAGQSPEGQPVYVTLTDEDDDPNQGPEMRINVGTDQAMKTPEIVWVANDQAASGLKVPVAQVKLEGKSLVLEGVTFTQNGSDRLTAKAPIRLDCGQSS